jgi:MoaA/NifB/PqqE/SkfB family radical SAM enzyme
MLIRTGEEKPLGPELIDLKCTNSCNSIHCNFCYMDSHPKGRHASLSWLIEQLETLKEKPFQIALGGGEPTMWPELFDFISYCNTNNICANTAVGPACDNSVVEKIVNNGVKAIGISFVSENKFFKTLKIAQTGNAFISAHCILRKDNIDQWISLKDEFSNSLNNVTFLLFKPHGRASGVANMLPSKDQFDALLDAYEGMSIGFDSCCYNGIIHRVHPDLLDRCDGGKYSLFIDGVEKTCSKCSFLETEYDLNNLTLGEVWSTIERVEYCKYAWKKRLALTGVDK